MTDAWDKTQGGASCLVAVIDTGVQWSHPDLAANIWTNPEETAGNREDDDRNGYVDDVRGWDFYANDNNPNDEGGHGTHVAGTIAAIGNNDAGVAGIAWSCKVMPLRFLGRNGGSTTSAIAALQYAVNKGVKVSNNSWGGGGYSTALHDAIAASKNIGHVFVAAAGNSGVNADTSPMYPAAYNLDNIVSVAATDNQDRLASFSNYGETSVDLGAPGVDIANTYLNNGYVYMSGTSMASPHVAGVAALVYLDASCTYDKVIAKILDSTDPVTALSGKTKTGGRLNADKALSSGCGGDPAPVPQVPSAPADLSAIDLKKGQARLSWTDASDNETGFRIERQKQNPKGVWDNSTSLQLSAGMTSYTDSPGAGVYQYRIQAYNSAGSSAFTGPAQVTVTK